MQACGRSASEQVFEHEDTFCLRFPLSSIWFSTVAQQVRIVYSYLQRLQLGNQKTRFRLRRFSIVYIFLLCNLLCV